MSIRLSKQAGDSNAETTPLLAGTELSESLLPTATGAAPLIKITPDAEVDDSIRAILSPTRSHFSGAAAFDLTPDPLDVSSSSQASTELKGLGLMALAAVGYSIMTMLVKWSGASMPSMQIVFARSVIQLVMGLAACGFYGIPIVVRGYLSKTFWRSFTGALGLGAYFFAMLYSTGPAFTTILAHFILDERATLVDATSCVSFLGGVILVSQPEMIFGPRDGRDHSLHPYRSYAIIMAVVGALMSALAFVLVRQIGSAVHSVAHVTWFGLVSSVLSAALLFGTQTPQVPANTEEWVLLIAVGVVAFFSQVCLNRGLQMAKAGPGVLVRNMDVVFAFIFGIVIFGEVPNTWDCLGTALIIGTAISNGVIKMISARRQNALIAARQDQA
ncbi:hypothetical protein RI367_001137 [Sorochytrium milnesiophthora]